MQREVSSTERTRSYDGIDSQSDASSSSSSPVSPRIVPRRSGLKPDEAEHGQESFVALTALALKLDELKKATEQDDGDVEGLPNGDIGLRSFLNGTDQVSVLTDNLASSPDQDSSSASAVNRRVEVKLPTGQVMSTVVCPFDDRVHYSAGDCDLTEMTSEELAESEKVFSQDFAELSFISRILSMSLDPEVPLLERFKFLCIVAQNLDEHFSKRLGNIINLDPDDLELFSHKMRQRVRPKTQYEDNFTIAVQTIVDRQYKCLEHDLLPELKTHGIEIVKYDEVPEHQQQALDSYFDTNLKPALTPIVLDPTHPFPLLQSHDLYIVAVLVKPLVELERHVLIRIPTKNRLVPIDTSKCRFVSAEDVCLANIGKICRGMILRKAYPFRVTRNIKLTIEDDTFGEIDYLLDYVIDECHRRRAAPATRMEVLENTPVAIVNLLTQNLGLDESDVYEVHSKLLDLGSCMTLAFVPAPALRETIREPVVPSPFKGLFERLQTKPGAIFDVISKKDVLVEYPKETFQNSAVLFLQAAARDPHVRSIKTALYRAGSKSPMVTALIRAAKNGKEVTVLVELKASFDEVQNSEYARDLQLAGCNVVYGLVGLKVHSKAILVVREQEDGTLATFSNVSTGNYNPGTAKLYTDVSLYTKRENVANELHDVFHSLTGYSDNSNYKTLLVAPVSMLQTFVELIRNEARNAREGKPARIACQMNGLSDKTITKELYEASQAGVKIDLIVRGPCRLRPEIPGKSDNIRVFSWLGPFLQHRRIFFFQNGDKGRFFVGSADWRTRNLHDRVEVVVPIEDRAICKRLSKAFDLVNDEKNVWRMSWDGRYYKGVSKQNYPPVSAEIWPAQAKIKDIKNKMMNGPKVTARLSAEQAPGFSRRISPKRRSKTRRRIEVNIRGDRVDVNKVCAGGVPIRFKEGEFGKLEGVEVLVVARDEPGDPWSVPKGGINAGESDKNATIRIAREKGGILACTEYDNIGWVLRKKKNKTIAVQTFVLLVEELGRFPSSIQQRKRLWMPLPDAIAEARRQGSDFTVDALLGARDALKSKLEPSRIFAHSAASARSVTSARSSPGSPPFTPSLPIKSAPPAIQSEHEQD